MQAPGGGGGHHPEGVGGPWQSRTKGDNISMQFQEQVLRATQEVICAYRLSGQVHDNPYAPISFWVAFIGIQRVTEIERFVIHESSEKVKINYLASKPSKC